MTQFISMIELERLQDNADRAEEAALDIGLEETFPASDPVAITITPLKEVAIYRVFP